jgi:putative addiction module CopG family antidote
MNVSLTADLEQWVSERIEHGIYQSPSEIVQEALLLLQEHDRLQQVRLKKLREHLTVGVTQLERGEGRPFTNDIVNEIKQQGRRQLGIEP